MFVVVRVEHNSLDCYIEGAEFHSKFATQQEADESVTKIKNDHREKAMAFYLAAEKYFDDMMKPFSQDYKYYMCGYPNDFPHKEWEDVLRKTGCSHLIGHVKPSGFKQEFMHLLRYGRIKPEGWCGLEPSLDDGDNLFVIEVPSLCKV